MSALLQTQLDAQPTLSSNDFMDIINTPPAVSTMTDMSQDPVQPKLVVGSNDTHQTILQRISQLEEIVRDGFDKITSKLSNTAVTAVTAVKQKGGRGKTMKKRRSGGLQKIK